ncbi:ABC transporter permease [Truepera radiovictrix]|uniref:Binding-protein-dependent transport systems inner membrane component n=1 Tax=Truepera radiovictrix (strain DSM 17093 / CIP 108686 / LMG 22925 / RQ-24) TaxID=649638 RepID=D7CSH8_TRURR|nr:ABC transporter permease [Truepera radiovictrix]ADI15398.1 binding-protein-dependent transport systems inner membrane component [Truepera radiovictrix DSM 17093]WMT56051.1 ABC transporter permease [Truepera radiovictrix]
MIAYLFRRLLNLIPTFFIATFLAWIVIELAPGDFASQFAFDQLDPGRAERIRQSLGLDQPWYVRYFYWLRNVVTGFDFGTSMTTRGDVTNLIWPRMVNSLTLLLPATILTYLIAIPIGVYSAVRKYSLGDRALTIFSLIGLAIPNFFLALLVVAFAVQFFQANGYLLIPVGGMTSQNHAQLSAWGQFADRLWHLIAPMLVIALSGLASISRFMRGEMLEVLGQDYIRTARAKGLSERVVNYKHGLRNAVIVIVATIGGVLPSLISGAGSVEYVLRWPGITPLFLRSIYAQDIYVIMALLTILTLLLMIGNLISDIALALIDPRIRY